MTTPSNLLHFENVLLKECIAGDRIAQQKLYNLYASKMYAICARYAGNSHDAQDIFQNGFLKVFKNINVYKGQGTLEGWMRKIFVTSSIDFIRTSNNRKDSTPFVDEYENLEDNNLTGFDKIAMEELLSVIQQLPPGYRTVFNMYLVEGFSHKEISEMLGIKETTSKSQLARAKMMLQKQILLLQNKIILK